jgi:hypothetical protein
MRAASVFSLYSLIQPLKDGVIVRGNIEPSSRCNRANVAMQLIEYCIPHQGMINPYKTYRPAFGEGLSGPSEVFRSSNICPLNRYVSSYTSEFARIATRASLVMGWGAALNRIVMWGHQQGACDKIRHADVAYIVTKLNIYSYQDGELPES